MTQRFTPLSGKSLIVTGGTGFLGSAFVRYAIDAGADVQVVARSTADHWRLSAYRDRYRVLTTTIEGLAELSVDIAKDTILVHFAAAGVNQTDDDIVRMVDTNIVGTLSTLAFAKQNGARRFVLVGSSGEYGPGVHLSEDAALRPTAEYGATRASATMLARAYGKRRDIEVTVVRPFAVFGPFEAPYRLIPYAILSALRGVPIKISSGQQTRDYVYVDDVSAGIASACVIKEAGGEIFNLCTGIETSVRDAASLVAMLVDKRVEVDCGVIPQIPGEMWQTSGDPSRAHKVLGWSPRVELTTGLEETINWFRKTGLRLPIYTE